jgi:CHAT domain-containing protein
MKRAIAACRSIYQGIVKWAMPTLPMVSLRRFCKYLRQSHLGLAIAVFLIIMTVQPAIATRDRISAPVEHSTPTLISQSGESLIERGSRAYQEGRLIEAIEQWHKALQIYRDRQKQASETERINAKLNEALCLNYLAIAQQDLGGWQSAEKFINLSLDLLEKSELANLATKEKIAIAAKAKNTKGSLQLAMGQPQTALDTWQAAAKLYEQIGDQIGQLGTRVNQAQALQSLGLYRQARDRLEAISQDLQKQSNSPLKALALRSLGNAIQTLGDLNQAQKLFEQSLEISQQLNHPAEVSTTLLSLANNYRSIPDVEVALQTYEKAAKLSPSFPLRLEIQAAQLSLLADLDRIPATQALWQQIESQLDPFNNPSFDFSQPSRRSIYVRVSIADSLIQLNERQPGTIAIAKIANILVNMVRQAQSLQDSRAESSAIGTLGKLYAQNQQFPEALQSAQKALLIAQASNDNDLLYQWQWLLGRLQTQQGQYDLAIASYRQAVQNIQELRKDLLVATPEVQFAFRDRVEPIYRELVALLLRDEQPGQEKLKQARQTLESLQVVELENFFRAACLDVEPKQIDAIDPNSAVIYSAILRDRFAVILSFPNAPLQYYTTAIPQSEVESTAETFFQSLNPAFSDRERLKVSQKLYDLMIRPGEKLLADRQVSNLVFVLDSSLRNLPPSAFHDGNQYLVEKYSIALTPGLQLLGAKSLDRSQLKVWLGGLSEAHQGFRELAEVKTEAEKIASQVPTNLELDRDFTKSNLQKGLSKSNSPIVHLATHGQFGSTPESTFILAWNDRITVPDFYAFLRDRTNNRGRPLELLVLSACQTAEGDKKATLGLAGLALRSGARSTLGSLWAVSDRSTSILMSSFYNSLIGQSNVSRAGALQKSQLSLLKDRQYQHPYYWASFVLVGSWL